MCDSSETAEDLHAALERSLLDAYFQSHGQTRDSVGELSETERTHLLRAASEYASLRLAEIESRARYVDEIHRSS
jgi:hypothetical protein